MKINRISLSKFKISEDEMINIFTNKKADVNEIVLILKMFLFLKFKKHQNLYMLYFTYFNFNKKIFEKLISRLTIKQ